MATTAAGGATVVRNTLNTLTARVVDVTPQGVKNVVKDGRAAFRAKPWNSTAVALALSSLILNFIAFFVRWSSYTNTPGVNGAVVNGYITLTDVANCLVNPSPSAYVPAVECSVYQLLSNAPTSLQWLYSAGAASLAFLLFALVANALGTWLTYLRRISSLHTIPTFMQRLHGENIMTTMYAQGVAAFCLMLSFAIWAGQVNSNFMEIESLKAFGMADISTGALIGSPAQSFSGGFAIVIIAWMFTPASAAILLWKQNEVEHVDVGAAAPAQGDPAAVQDAFPQAGAAPALPPGTLPPPTYAPQASGGYSAPGGSVGYAPPVSGML